jgi:hypothetical protein
MMLTHQATQDMPLEFNLDKTETLLMPLKEITQLKKIKLSQNQLYQLAMEPTEQRELIA